MEKLEQKLTRLTNQLSELQDNIDEYRRNKEEFLALLAYFQRSQMKWVKLNGTK
jgi:predicted RNase H-like nuclease (RuvC/YqgF family)